MKDQPALVKTMTGEIYQPVRLYYRIHDMDRVLRIFNKMSCMDFDQDNKRWTWLYDGEAKSLNFKTPYSAIPKESRPIVLGSFYSCDSNEMHLDIGSIERATTAIVFFDKQIEKKVAEVTYCAIYNKILPLTEKPGANFDKLFADVITDAIDAKQEAEISRVVAMVKSGRVMDVLQERRFDLVEAFPTNFYPYGIQQIEVSLQMRQTVALKRWMGDKEFTLSELLSRTVQRKPLR